MANQFLSLSLFMMLLSFFIIMNSVSEFEDNKARAVLNSIAIAFSAEATPQDMRSSLEDDVSKSLRKGTTLDKIEAIFRTQVTGLKVKKNRLGTEMWIHLSVEEFDSMLNDPIRRGSDNISLAAGESNLFPVLLSLLDAQDTIPYRMDLVLNTVSNPAQLQNEKPEFFAQTLKKVSAYAQKLEEMGMPRKLITSGVVEGEENMIDLVFRRYTVFDPAPRKTRETQEKPG